MSGGRSPADPAPAGDPSVGRGLGADGLGPAFDSHLHLTDSRFDADRAEALRRARAAGVEEMVTVGTDPADARDAIELARAETGIWATAGLHPHDARRFSPRLLEEIRSLAAEDEVVAVGETGLDFHYENSPRPVQLESFRAHLALAEELGLPVIVHSREADRETAETIEAFAGRVRGVLHCFTGGDLLLEAGLEADWYVSFSGIVTFGGPQLENRARRVPEERLLAETDSPYLAPAPRRGRRNEPAFLLHTCAHLATLRGVDTSALVASTRRNARILYGLEGR